MDYLDRRHQTCAYQRTRCCRADLCPGADVLIGGEAAHVLADLRQDRLGASPPQARDPIDHPDGSLKRAHPILDLHAQLCDLLFQVLNKPELVLQQVALVGTKGALQGQLQLRPLPLEAAASQASQLSRMLAPCDQGLEHRTTARAQDVGSDIAELDVGAL